MSALCIRGVLIAFMVYGAYKTNTWSSDAHQAGHYDWSRHFQVLASIALAGAAIIAAITVGGLP